MSDPGCRCGHPRGEHKQGEADGCLHGWGVPGSTGCYCTRFDFPSAASSRPQHRGGPGWGIHWINDIDGFVRPFAVRDAIEEARSVRGYLKASTETWARVKSVSLPPKPRMPWEPDLTFFTGVPMIVDEDVPADTIEVSTRHPAVTDGN